jgi:hypothetical protein
MNEFKFTSKSSFQDFLTFKKVSEEDKADAEKMAGIYNDFNAGLRSAIEEAEKNQASKEEVTALKAELKDAMKEQFIALQTILKEQGKAILSMNKGEGSTLSDVRSTLEQNKEALKLIASGADKAKNIVFTVKAAGNMAISTNTTGQIPQAEREAGINAIRVRRPRLMDYITIGSIGSKTKEWVYQANKDGAAGVTAEGAIKNQIDFDLLVGSEKVEKITAYIVATDEMLEDIDQMQTAIETELTVEINKVLESQVFGGSGTTPNLNGISTVAPSFAAGTFAGTIDNPNVVDVLAVAQNQIELAEQDAPTAIFMNPSDVTSLLVEKVSSTDKRYIERLQMIAGTLSFDGTPIVKTTLVTAGEFLMGDFTKARLDFKKGLTIEIGYNADNFVKNFKTIRGELRAVCSVKHNDRTAFVKGVFATAKAALATT